MENRLNEILDTINGFYVYTDDMAHKYITLIREVIDLLSEVEAPPTSMLENAKEETISELSTELANRMYEKTFFSSPLERRKSEFKISKALVVVSIGNVLSNLAPVSYQYVPENDAENNVEGDAENNG